jgi:flagellar basal-body rod protein FlgC
VVALGKVKPDQSSFRVKYEPSIGGDQAGNVKYPNVNPLVEMTDMREASDPTKRTSHHQRHAPDDQRTLDILKA